MLHARPHQLPDTENLNPPLNQHLYTLARNHARTRNGNIPESVDVMGQHCLENHDALFWINPFVMSRSPTHQKHNVSEISDTRKDTTTTTTKTHSKEQLATLDTTRFLGTFLPSVCRTRNNRNPRENLYHKKQHERHRTIRTRQAKAPTKSQPQKPSTNPYHNTTCN